MNVADFATKFRPATDNYKEWFEGPSCLKHTHSWYRLKRDVANWIMYVERKLQKLQQQKLVERLNSTHLVRAKNIILKMAQIENFLMIMLQYKAVDPILKVVPYATSACGPQRDLIILSGKHHVTKLIIMDYHRAYHHLNHETVLNEIRQIYFIVKLRAVYKSVRRNCQQCKIDNAKPISPQMAYLPPARLAAFQRPFTFVGVDYFGPITVTFGRKSLKRWGVIFTCLTIRAFHIEIAHTLTADSFLLTLRNFIARRGTPAEIYSDNGTNFRGADRFLQEYGLQQSTN
ncbi:uncharacterized protein LOC135950632 [Calliphora vicina]|uniref:uncharacterized protein LOC135950632 n=1 Tax=Calliphora vicina TaxID=7373 RepID=UPI00325A63A4